MGEAINLVNNFKVEKVIFNCGEFNELEQDLIKVLDKKKIPYYSCIKELNIDDNKLYILNNKDYGNENDNSSVIYTELNDYKFLFMGDAGVEVEEDIIIARKYELCDIINVGSDGMLKKKEIIYLDILRIFACFMVVINHTNGYVLENKNLANVTFYCVLFSLCKVGVALFLMITGVLVINKTYSYKKILKCILRVLIPVFCFSLIFYIEDNGINNLNIVLFLKSILSKPYIVAYWYIYAIIGMYISLPFVQKMIKKFTNQDYKIFTILFLIVPAFINYLKIGLNFNVNSNLESALFPMIIATIVCGNYISKIEISNKKLLGSIVIFVVSYITMFLSMFLPFLSTSEISYALDSWNSLPVILMSITLFYICRYLFENKKYSNKMTKIITTIASTTFGIYLIHTSLKIKLYKLDIIQTLFSFNDILAAIILNVMVFLVCMIITYILKKIPFIKKYL